MTSPRSVLVAALLLLASLLSLGMPAATATGLTPWVSVTPGTGLAKGDVVVVTAGRLRPYRVLNVIQCDRWVANPDLDSEPGNCATTRTTTVDSNGRVRVPVTLRDPVSVAQPFGDGQLVYCRADHCRIFLAWTDAYGVDHAVRSPELRFTGSPATITVTPSTGLATKQWVKVRGTAFGAEGHTLKIREQSCYRMIQGSGCIGDVPFTWAKVRADGTYAVSYQAVRLLPVADWPGPVLGFMDCADFNNRLGDCQITVTVLNSKGQADRTFGDSSIGDPRGSLEFAAP